MQHRVNNCDVTATRNKRVRFSKRLQPITTPTYTLVHNYDSDCDDRATSRNIVQFRVHNCDCDATAM